MPHFCFFFSPTVLQGVSLDNRLCPVVGNSQQNILLGVGKDQKIIHQILDKRQSQTV